MNAYYIVAVEYNKTWMFAELALYVAYVVGLVTTAKRNIEKDDKKEIEKKILESEVVLREVNKLINKFRGLLGGTLVVTIDERVHMTILKYECDDVREKLISCIKTDNERLTQLKKTF